MMPKLLQPAGGMDSLHKFSFVQAPLRQPRVSFKLQSRCDDFQGCRWTMIALTVKVVIETRMRMMMTMTAIVRDSLQTSPDLLQRGVLKSAMAMTITVMTTLLVHAAVVFKKLKPNIEGKNDPHTNSRFSLRWSKQRPRMLSKQKPLNTYPKVE